MPENNEAIRVVVNGKETEVPIGSTIKSFLDAKGLQDRLVVVELNEAIIPRPSFDETELSPNDVVEIVHFVGGG